MVAQLTYWSVGKLKDYCESCFANCERIYNDKVVSYSSCITDEDIEAKRAWLWETNFKRSKNI